MSRSRHEKHGEELCGKCGQAEIYLIWVRNTESKTITFEKLSVMICHYRTGKILCLRSVGNVQRASQFTTTKAGFRYADLSLLKPMENLSTSRIKRFMDEHAETGNWRR